jgi:hypothetical protein
MMCSGEHCREQIISLCFLFTDSGDNQKQQGLAQMRQIMAAEANLPEAEQLTLHMIGIGPYVDEEFVRIE